MKIAMNNIVDRRTGEKYISINQLIVALHTDMHRSSGLDANEYIDGLIDRLIEMRDRNGE